MATRLELYTSFFRVDPRVFLADERRESQLTETNDLKAQVLDKAVRDFFKSIRVVPDKWILPNSRGPLVVRATLHDLDTIERELVKLVVAPPGGQSGLPQSTNLVVKIGANGNLTLGQTPVTIDQLRTNLMAESAKHPELRLEVQADKSAPLKAIVKVMDLMKEAGIGRAALGSGSTPRSTTLTAEQAGALAQQLANEEAQALYNCQPFRNGQPAELAQGKWVWHDRRTRGTVDIEATVRFALDGTDPDVKVTPQDSRPGRSGF